MENYQKYLDPKVLNKISRLDLKARLIVEGFVSGLHRSPYHGFSVEFAQHREYTPGDDLRHLDWKVYGRSDRLYLKEYEQETNLRAYIVLDTSESMKYGSGEVTKLEYACYIAASLTHLIIEQQDAVGFARFDNEVRRYIPSSASMAHKKNVLQELTTLAGERKTRTGAVLHTLAERIRNRGLVILISDLFDNRDEIFNGLQHFRHKGHDVIVFNVLDEYEVKFPFERMIMFEGLEEIPHVLADPRALRKEYLQEVDHFTTELRRRCLEQRIDFVQITTDQFLDVALSSYLARRLATKRSR